MQDINNQKGFLNESSKNSIWSINEEPDRNKVIDYNIQKITWFSKLKSLHELKNETFANDFNEYSLTSDYTNELNLNMNKISNFNVRKQNGIKDVRKLFARKL